MKNRTWTSLCMYLLVRCQQALGLGCWKTPQGPLTDTSGQPSWSIYPGSCLWPETDPVKRHTPHQPSRRWFTGTHVCRKSSRVLSVQPKSESTINLPGKQVYKLKLCLNKHSKLKCWTEPQNMSSFFIFIFLLITFFFTGAAFNSMTINRFSKFSSNIMTKFHKAWTELPGCCFFFF